MYGVPSDEIDKIEFQYQRSRNEGKGNVRREARKRNWWHVLDGSSNKVSEIISCEEFHIFLFIFQIFPIYLDGK